MVALSNARDLAYVANIGSGSISVIRLAATAEQQPGFVREIETGAGAEGIAVHPGTGAIWVTNRAADTVSIIDPEALEVVATLPCAGFPIRVAFTPTGDAALVSCARKGSVAVFDAESKERLREIAMDAEAVDDPDGRLFAGEFGKSPVPVGVLVEPRGRFAYVANTQADIVTEIDLETWRITRRLRAGAEPDGMAFVAVR